MLARRGSPRFASRWAPVRARLVSLLLALLVVTFFARPGTARASEPETAREPRDVPMVVQPEALVLPALPDTDQVRDLGWLRVAYPPSAHERVEPILRGADQMKAELADELGQPVLTKVVEVRIARSPEDMMALAPPDTVPGYATAIAVPPLRLIIISMRSPFSNEGTDIEETLRHELAHVALADALAGQRVPRWFNEGFAVHASGERPWERNEALGQATVMKTLAPLTELDHFPDRGAEVDVAYAESADFVRFLLSKGDRLRFASMIDRARRGEPFERALGDAYGSDLKKLEYQWREQLAQRYTFWPVLMSGSIIWVFVIGALGLGWLKKKRKARAVYARWDREDAAMEAARRAAIAPSMLPESGVVEASMRPRIPSVPKIEHDGGWHTVH